MSEDQRRGVDPVPHDVTRYLNDDQLAQLHTIEGFGWKLKYIRRPTIEEVVIIVSNQEGSSIGILEDDGRLNLEPNIETRD